MFAVTGSTLGECGYLGLLKDPIVQSMSKHDYLVMLGNSGITEPRVDFRETVSKYRDLPCSILVIDGSTDDYDLLSDHPLFPWNGGMTQNLSRNITRLMRGQVFAIQGKTIFSMGGALSKERTDFGKYYDWWPEQEISEEDLMEAESNLAHREHVDWVFSCERPACWDSNGGYAILDGLSTRIPYGHWYFSNSPYTMEYPEHRATQVGTTVISLS